MSKIPVKLPPFKVRNVVTSLSQIIDWNVKQLSVPNTWTITQGEDIVVLVIDTGFSDHKDLREATLRDKSKSFVAEEPIIDDYAGHSTHCQGIIGARNNMMGMVGVAPKCILVTCKVLDKYGQGDMNGVCDALEYAKILKPDVISMSLGTSLSVPRMQKLIKELYAMNIPVVAAAGNDGEHNSVNYPGKYEEVICVTAFDKNNKPADFNSTGEEVFISAPGVDIYSTWTNNTYACISGTSMACPFIAGVIALLIAKHRKQEKETGQNDCKTVDQIKEHLKKYSNDSGVIGKDPVWGYGMVDPMKLINESETITPSTPKVESLSFWQKIKKIFSRNTK
jgi:subtilisin family serine protease